MKADTYIEFQKINARIDKLTAAWNAFLAQESDKKKVKAADVSVRAQTKKLQEAIPADAASTSRRRKS